MRLWKKQYQSGRVCGKEAKEIYWGPGIRAIFYQSGSIWLIVACLYLGIGWLGQSYAKAARNADDNRVFRISGLFSGVCGAGMVAGCAEPHAGADRLASLFPELSVGTSHAVCRRDHDTGQCDRSSFIYGCFGKSICEYGSGGKQQCVFVCFGLCICLPQRRGWSVLCRSDRSLGVCVRDCKACGNWRADVSFFLHQFRWRCTARSLPQAFVFCSYQ